MSKVEETSEVEKAHIKGRREGILFGIIYTIAVYALTVWTNGMLDQLVK